MGIFYRGKEMRLKDKKCGNCYHSFWYHYEDGSKLLWCLECNQYEPTEVEPDQKKCDQWEFDEEDPS